MKDIGSQRKERCHEELICTRSLNKIAADLAETFNGKDGVAMLVADQL